MYIYIYRAPCIAICRTIWWGDVANICGQAEQMWTPEEDETSRLGSAYYLRFLNWDFPAGAAAPPDSPDRVSTGGAAAVQDPQIGFARFLDFWMC